MGLFGWFKKKEKMPGADMTQAELDNYVFMVHLLLKEKTAMPAAARMTQVLSRHMGNVGCFAHNDSFAGFSANDYHIKWKKGKSAPQVWVADCQPLENLTIDEAVRRQMWDCPDSERILAECRYKISAADMYAYLMPYRERAEMDMDFLEALMELFPQCEAVYFQTSGKLFTRDQIVGRQISKKNRFIYFAVNVRFFTMEDSNEQVIDTLGMGLLGLPDLQYHFHDFDPNWVVTHAYNTAAYIYGGEKKIRHGDHIDGIKDGEFDVGVQWSCHYEHAMIQPDRTVIDICMNEYAAGKRDDKKR